MESSSVCEAADLLSVVDAFKRCRKADGTLATDHYLAAVNELVKLFHSFGMGVSLALHGMDKSIKRLELLRVTGAGRNYSSFDQLLIHEQHLNMDTNNNKSGTSSVNKLHLYVEFMLDFLQKLKECLDKSQSYNTADKVAIYQKTVATFHPNYVQASVRLLLMRTPGRHELLKKLGLGARGVASPREILRDILLHAYPVHKTIGELVKQEHTIKRTGESSSEAYQVTSPVAKC